MRQVKREKLLWNCADDSVLRPSHGASVPRAIVVTLSVKLSVKLVFISQRRRTHHIWKTWNSGCCSGHTSNDGELYREKATARGEASWWLTAGQAAKPQPGSRRICAPSARRLFSRCGGGQPLWRNGPLLTRSLCAVYE
jgi:hypothetical protein